MHTLTTARSEESRASSVICAGRRGVSVMGEFDEMEWNGMEWNGMQCNAMQRNAILCYANVSSMPGREPSTPKRSGGMPLARG